VTPPIALTLAGSDPSGGAGLQADLKTFHQHGVYGEAVVTLVTVQNTRGVTRVEVLDEGLVIQQLDAVLADLPPAAAKTGALGNAKVVRAVAQRAKDFRFPLVVDPVMVSKHGHRLLDEAASEALVKELLPRTFLLTPNAEEAAVLCGRAVRTLEDAREAAKAIAKLGPKAVLVKGGHVEGDAVDVLFHEGTLIEYRAPRLDAKHTHGTGCTLSAAITARLARGETLPGAVAGAKAWLTEALRTAPELGSGVGPVNHLAPVK